MSFYAKTLSSMQDVMTNSNLLSAARSAVILAALLVGGPVLAQEPGSEGAPKSEPGAAPAAVIGVSTSVIGSGETAKTEVRIQLSNASLQYSYFYSPARDQLYIDIPNAAVGAASIGSGVSAAGLVAKVEFAPFDGSNNNTRVVLSLSGKATHDLRTDGTTIVVTLTPGVLDDPLADDPSDIRLSGPESVAAGPVLTSLDYQQRERSSVVVLGLKEVPEPVISTPRSDLIIIDLPGAVMPTSLRRQLDTRFFASAINDVRAYTTRDGTRVAITLRANTTYRVERKDNLYLIEFDTPPEILQARDRSVQRMSPAAPGTPGTSGTESSGNAANDPALITPNGRVVDPNSTNAANPPGTYSFARPTGTPDVRYSGRRISIDLQGADIHTVFRFLAEYGDVNIVASDDVEGKVTVRLVEVPWDEALAAILQAQGLGAQQFGNIIRVATLDQIKEEEAAIAAAKAERDKTEPLLILVVPLNYAQADELVDKIEVLLTERGTVEVDTRGNQLIVQDTAEAIAKIQATLAHVDKPNRQLVIEARFVEANSSFSRSLGISWGADVDASAATGFPTGAYFPNSIRLTGADSDSLGTVQNLMVDLGAGLTSGGGLGVSLGSISGLIDLEARLQALEQEGWGKIVSAPNLLVIDNETATVEQGARIPYLSVSQGGTNVQFVKAALEMEITPHITAEGTIFLDVTITNNRPDFGQQVQGQPAILTKQIHTRILVADGDTAVLGGVYTTSESWAQSRLPLLGKIPIIGYLFKNSSVKNEQQEMIVFITPHIVPLDEASIGTY
jgi:type IV pilus assembly protein PilQ